MNVWEIVFNSLKEQGFDIYPPATKTGECKKPYIVLESGGGYQINNYSSQKVLYNFYLYVPKNKYSELSDYEASVKNALAQSPIYPMLLPTGQKENDYFDDNINAHLRVITYYNNVRVQHL